jgi:hypothetical protein
MAGVFVTDISSLIKLIDPRGWPDEDFAVAVDRLIGNNAQSIARMGPSRLQLAALGDYLSSRDAHHSVRVALVGTVKTWDDYEFLASSWTPVPFPQESEAARGAADFIAFTLPLMKPTPPMATLERLAPLAVTPSSRESVIGAGFKAAPGPAGFIQAMSLVRFPKEERSAREWFLRRSLPKMFGWYPPPTLDQMLWVSENGIDNSLPEAVISHALAPLRDAQGNVFRAISTPGELFVYLDRLRAQGWDLGRHWERVMRDERANILALPAGQDSLPHLERYWTDRSRNCFGFARL